MVDNRSLKTLIMSLLLFGFAFGEDSEFPLEVDKDTGCLITNADTGTGETVYVYLPQLLSKPDTLSFYYDVDSGSVNSSASDPNLPTYTELEKSILNAWEPLTVDSTNQDLASFDFGSTFFPDAANPRLSLLAVPREEGDTNYQVYYGTGETFNPLDNQVWLGAKFYWGLYTLREGSVNEVENLSLFVCAPAPGGFTTSFPIPKDGSTPSGGSIASGP